MSKRRKGNRKAAVAAPPTREATIASLTYYVVVLIAALVGCISYTSGATLEGAFIRTVVVLLICMVLGYAFNVILWLATHDSEPKEEADKGQTAKVGVNLDLTAGDDEAVEANLAASLSGLSAAGK